LLVLQKRADVVFFFLVKSETTILSYLNFNIFVMADVSDSSIDDAYAKVRKNDGEINWLLLGYENNKKIVLVGSGGGGVSEMAGNVSADGCFYGYLRVVLQDDETKRTKFVFVTFKGDNAPVMRKGNMSVHINNVKTKIKDFSVQVNATEASELTEEAVLGKIKSANY